MLKIVTLGPAGTFSELATHKFIKQQSESCNICFLPSIKSVLHEIDHSVGAIVPSGSFNSEQFALTIDCVNDYENNQTRFLVLSRNNIHPISNDANKTSIIVLDDDDHPGLLGEVLQSFSARQINLSSIISRPTRKSFGKYHFFIELEGSQNDPLVASALQEISQRNKVKVLGAYKTATLQS